MKSDEHVELARVVRGLLGEATLVQRGSGDGARTNAASVLRSRLAALGIRGIGIAESCGGSGGGLGELAVVAQEIGRSLSPVSIVATTAAGVILRAAGGCDDLLVEIASGAGVALAIAQPGWTAPGIGPLNISCVVTGGHLIVSGTVSGVFDADNARHVIVVPSRESDPVLIELDGAGTRVESRTAMSQVHDVCSLRFDGAVARRLVVDSAVVVDALAQARVALTFEMLGANDVVIEMALDHARSREQFGQPIGSFQAVAHRLADAHVRRYASSVSAAYALRAHGSEQFALAAAVARDVSAQALIVAAHQAIQVHGAVAHTWEHPLHHYVKFARVSERLLASPDGHLSDLLHASGRP